MTPKPKTESQIQTEIQNYLALKGYLTVRVNTIQRGWKKSYRIANNGKCSGFPDILAIKNNNSLLIEVKDEKGKQEPTQKSFQRLCEHTGNNYYIARSIEDVDKIIGAN